MAEADLVETYWSDISQLSGLLEGSGATPMVEAIFVSPWSDWRLVAVIQNLDRSGVRPIYRAIEEFREAHGGTSQGLSERLLLLDAEEPDGRLLLMAPEAAPPDLVAPPRRLPLQIEALPDYLGAIVRRAPRVRSYNLERLSGEVVDALLNAGWNQIFENRVWLRSSTRFDLTLVKADGLEVPIELKMLGRGDGYRRIVEASGRANLLCIPIVLVLATTNPDPQIPQRRFGVVPVFPVLWWDEGPSDPLLQAVRDAEYWIGENKDFVDRQRAELIGHSWDRRWI